MQLNYRKDANHTLYSTLPRTPPHFRNEAIHGQFLCSNEFQPKDCKPSSSNRPVLPLRSTNPPEKKHQRRLRRHRRPLLLAPSAVELVAMSVSGFTPSYTLQGNYSMSYTLMKSLHQQSLIDHPSIENICLKAYLTCTIISWIWVLHSFGAPFPSDVEQVNLILFTQTASKPCVAGMVSVPCGKHLGVDSENWDKNSATGAGTRTHTARWEQALPTVAFTHLPGLEIPDVEIQVVEQCRVFGRQHPESLGFAVQ